MKRGRTVNREIEIIWRSSEKVYKMNIGEEKSKLMKQNNSEYAGKKNRINNNNDNNNKVEE